MALIRTAAFLVACALVACRADPPAVTPEPSAPSQSESRAAGAVPRSVEDWLDGVDAIVLGEIHGAVEMPAAALEAARELLERGERVVLAIETWRSDQRLVDGHLQKQVVDIDAGPL